MGDEEAERRRRMDETRSYYGRGPRGYTRSDERIKEDVSDRLTDDWYVDASEIEVTVNNGEVTLSGTVDSRQAKRRAEDIVDDISGVRHVQNNLRVRQSSTSSITGSTATGTSSMGTSMTGSSNTGSSTTGTTTSGTTGSGTGSTTRPTH
jgi:hypothetical protein